MKWIAYKKSSGVALYDSSQEGAQLINTTFNGYDDTLKAQAIQAIQVAIDSIEADASSITGVFQEKLGGIQQRDAVNNVKVGVRQSTLLTKQYFHAMDLMFKEANYDMLNLAKIVYKDGITGELILGPKLRKTFTALPEHYTMTDFDLHIQDSSEIFQVKENMTAMGGELIKGGAAGPDLLVNMLLAKNVSQLKQYIDESVAEKKEENDTIGQLQQQLQQMQQQIQQYEQQMKQLQQQNQQYQQKVDQMNQAKIQIEQERLKIDQQKVDDARDYNERIAKNKEKQVEIEL